MINLLVDTLVDEIAENTDIQDQTDDGAGLSLREAIEVANGLAGADTILFDPSLLGQIFDISSGGIIDVIDDLTISGGVDIFNTTNDAAIQISSDAFVTFDDFSFTQMGQDQFSSAVLVTGDNASLTNNANILASGVNEFSGDRSIGVEILATNFTLINEVDGEIVTLGRRAVEGVSLFSDTTVDFVIDVINHGLIEGPDDGVSITSGTVTNSGTIRTTATFDFGGNFGLLPGITSDAIQFWGAENAGYVTPTDGQGVVNNLATGIIEGGRSAIFLAGNGTVNNDGIITALGGAILGSGRDAGVLTPTPITINNTGTITAEAFDFSPDFGDVEDLATIALSGSLAASSIDINNSGTIGGEGIAVRIFQGGATLNNEASGQILSNTDGLGNDGLAFLGDRLEDFAAEATTSFIFPAAFDIVENTQGITVVGDGIFRVPDLGNAEFESQFGQTEVVFVLGSSILPLVDLAATQNSGFLTFQTDASGNVIFAPTIDISTSNNGIVTVEFDSATGFTITDANGNPIFDVPTDVDFADTIINRGEINGDIFTGLGEDVVTNTGTIDGTIHLGEGEDIFNGSTQAETVFGGTEGDTLNGRAGDDILDGEEGNDTLNGGAGNDTLRGDAGEDVLIGAAGNDSINGGGDNDTINGGGGNDTINGGAGMDILLGSTGADVINGAAGDDTINGGNQNDMLFGASGADTLNGGSGNDNLDGGGGNDVLIGGAGADTIIGGTGNDVLEGNSGGDDLFGGGGNDTLFGGGGNDDLYGEAGADTFVFTAAIGVDRIKDFEDGIDTIDLSGFVLGNDFADVMDAATQVGANVRLDFNANNSIILEGFDISDLDAMDFVF